MPHILSAAVLLEVLCLVSPAIRAQDTRTVTEPVFPPVCSQLTAQLSADATTGILAGGPLLGIPVDNLDMAIDTLTGGYSGDNNYAGISFGKYQVEVVDGLPACLRCSGARPDFARENQGR
jgi:hypothetical protein